MKLEYWSLHLAVLEHDWQTVLDLFSNTFGIANIQSDDLHTSPHITGGMGSSGIFLILRLGEETYQISRYSSANYKASPSEPRFNGRPFLFVWVP